MASDSKLQSLDKHIPGLDGIRGLAILGVLVFHVATFDARGRLELAVKIVTSFGWAGVDLFFVLSGFLITGILLRARGGAGYYRTFYVRRTLRIFPLYYGYCAVLFLVLPYAHGLGTPESAALVSAAPWYLTYLMNVRVALANNWVPATVAGTAFFWSLGVEEQFYLLWPWTVARLPRARLRALCLALVVVALAWRVLMVRSGHTFAAYVLLPARMDSLAMGAWLAIAVRAPSGLERMARRAPWALAGAGAALVLLVVRTGYAGWDNPWMATIGMSCTAIASAALIVLVVARPASLLGRAASSVPLRFFGRYAYGIYMLGGVAGMLVAMTPLLGLVPSRVMGSALPRLLWDLIVLLSAVTLVALVSWSLIERPALSLKRFFPYDGRPAAGSPGTDASARVRDPIERRVAGDEHPERAVISADEKALGMVPIISD